LVAQTRQGKTCPARTTSNLSTGDTSEIKSRDDEWHDGTKNWRNKRRRIVVRDRAGQERDKETKRDEGQRREKKMSDRRRERGKEGKRRSREE
jgi:hypothetical protein